MFPDLQVAHQSLVDDDEEESAIEQPAALTAESLIPYLQECRYDESRLAFDYGFGADSVPVAGFAHAPRDARSICIGAVDARRDPAASIAALEPLGAPVVLACHSGRLQWWKLSFGAPQLLESVDAAEIPRFFEEHRSDFAPSTVFKGKTRGRLPGQLQLPFVDVGLMPRLEREMGNALSRLVESMIGRFEDELGRPMEAGSEVERVFQPAFWLLAAKILHDKGAPGFTTTDLRDVDEAFERVARHYGGSKGLPWLQGRWRRAAEAAAELVSEHSSLAHVSAESLAHLYENSLVPMEVRRALRIHSTPSPLVDYIVWQLWPWIEEIPEDRRHVFEPACGHGAFLVAAMRVLRESSSTDEGRVRHDYLRSHLHGIEIDAFAIEIAKLSLTLADMPHGNSWGLDRADIFGGSLLEERASGCGVLLANPPFGKLPVYGKGSCGERRGQQPAGTMPHELLRRTLPHLPSGAVFGVVVPVGLLHSRESAELRGLLLNDFEIAEINVFADTLFENADQEVAVLLGRRKSLPKGRRTTWFRRVREAGVQAFRESFEFSSELRVDRSRFLESKSADLRIPELDSVWQYLDSNSALGDIASIGQGLFHVAQSDLPEGAWTVGEPTHETTTLGYARVAPRYSIYELPRLYAINLDEAVIDRWVAGAPTGQPQVLLNYAPVSRGPWKLRASLDLDGRPLTNRFSAVRPKSESDGVSALYLWALLNSPVANAFVYSHLGKRDILIGFLRERLPVPRWSHESALEIESAAQRYRDLASHPGPLFATSTEPGERKRALLSMDAAVLKAYELPPRLERQLLELFSGVDRQGVGCKFDGYYPPGFDSFLPLNLIISDMFERAKADRLKGEGKLDASPYVRSVLAEAVDAFASR